MTDETFVLAADMVLESDRPDASSQDCRTTMPAVRNGRIVVDADRRTSLPGVYAGGDCVAGADLTVTAVQDGKLAAAAIHRQLIG